MISIGAPYVTKDGGCARLNSRVSIDGYESVVWCEVDGKYSPFLCEERSDAFLLGFLPYAMQFRHDIQCDAPVTKRLREQLEECFVLPYCTVNPMTYKPRIFCEVADEVTHGGRGIGTGVSCGVDSLHVFATHPEITHGCVFNMFVRNHVRDEETRRMLWRNMRIRARRFCDEIGVELVEVDTNFDKGILPDLKYEYHVTYANLFAIFALQKLFSVYYIASGYGADQLTLNTSIDEDCALYDHILLPAVSLSKIMIRLWGAERRIDKVKILVNYPPAMHHLNVCWETESDGKNCTHRCGKCKRTLLELEALDAVDEFSEVFDVEWYKSHRREYMLEYYSGVRRCEVYAMELQPLLHHKFKMLCLGDRLWIYLHYWGMATIVSILRNRFIRNLWHFVRDEILHRRKNA